MKVKLENQPWYVKLWEMVNRDNQLDKEYTSEKILSKLENMESCMVAMQKNMAQMKEKIEKMTSKQIGVPENKSEDTA